MGGPKAMLRLLARRVEAETASIRVGVALLSLERHYRQDQPRVPAGSPEGGQWTLDQPPASGSAPRTIGTRFGPIKFSGLLTGRRSQGGVVYCLYFDSREQYTFSVPAEAGGYCPAIRLHY